MLLDIKTTLFKAAWFLRLFMRVFTINAADIRFVLNSDWIVAKSTVLIGCIWRAPAQCTNLEMVILFSAINYKAKQAEAVKKIDEHVNEYVLLSSKTFSDNIQTKQKTDWE